MSALLSAALALAAGLDAGAASTSTLAAQAAPAASGPSVLGWVAVLVLLAAVGAFVARRSVGRKASTPAPAAPVPGPGPTEAGQRPSLPPSAPYLGVVPPAPVGPLAPKDLAQQTERLSREAKARSEAEEKAKAAAAAGEKARALDSADTAAKAAAQADADRLAREADELRRKADYEARKAAEADEKARRAAEAEAKRAAEQAATESAVRAAQELKAAEEAGRAKLVAQETGRTLSEGLAKTRGGFMARLNALFGTGKQLDEAALGELEEILFSADIGVRTATALLESVRERLKRRELADLSKVKAALREEIERILALGHAGGLAAQTAHGGLPALPAGVAGPQVVMVVGVNGTGKTTTIGKLAARLRADGRKVLLGAGDTFRAAAGEQLDIWAERAGVPIVRGKDGGDPGSVLFDAVAKGRAEGFDVVLCDTAGRLHTKSGLMDELVRMKKTLDKAHPGSPHEVLLVVDATTGQNAIAQARQFHEALGVSGFVLTKLDGTAKGGVIVGICDELKIPVRYVGVGETAADLKPFDPHEFVSALFG
jgi:fused signal recognition particle receptor